MPTSRRDYDPNYKTPATLGKMPLENGLRIYVEKPASSRYKWQVRAQFKLTLEGKVLLLPAKTNIKAASEPYDPNNFAQNTPIFGLTGRDYWADEKTNKPAEEV